MGMQFAGAKRARVSKDKETKIRETSDELQGLLNRLGAEQHASVVSILAHIQAMHTFDREVAAMPAPVATKVSFAIAAPTTEQRVVSLSKVISEEHFNRMGALEQVVKNGKNALRLAIELSLVKGYGSTDGTINWERLRDDLARRVG
jgi:hypothetical protein